MRGWNVGTEELVSYACISEDVVQNIVTSTEICLPKYEYY